jgi:hypothetical protein
VQYPIPGNDTVQKSIRLAVDAIADAFAEGAMTGIGYCTRAKSQSELESAMTGIFSWLASFTAIASWRESTTNMAPGSLEGKIVQDADRIDALGAIGIARVFAYGGFRGRQIYNPQVKPKKVMPKKLAVKEATSLNHFYEKLLRLKDLMNTREGKKMARARHKYLENYLNQFLKEWEGKI